MISETCPCGATCEVRYVTEAIESRAIGAFRKEHAECHRRWCPCGDAIGHNASLCTDCADALQRELERLRALNVDAGRAPAESRPATGTDGGSR